MHAPLTCKSASGPKAVHISGVNCTTTTTLRLKLIHWHFALQQPHHNCDYNNYYYYYYHHHHYYYCKVETHLLEVYAATEMKNSNNYKYYNISQLKLYPVMTANTTKRLQQLLLLQVPQSGTLSVSHNNH